MAAPAGVGGADVVVATVVEKGDNRLNTYRSTIGNQVLSSHQKGKSKEEAEHEHKHRGLREKLRLNLRTFDASSFKAVGFFDCMERLGEGDLVLFHTDRFTSRLQRAFVKSGGFDHVGIIVTCDDCPDSSCCPKELKLARKSAGIKAWHTLEADSGGVSLYRFTPTCLGAYRGVVCIRHLDLDPKRFDLPQLSHKLADFVQAMNGRPYEKSTLQMVRAANIFGSNEEEDLSSVFCSELVAAAYKNLGLLAERDNTKRPSNSYIPGDFASKNKDSWRAVKLVQGAHLSKEVIIDCTNMHLRSTSSTTTNKLASVVVKSSWPREHKVASSGGGERVKQGAGIETQLDAVDSLLLADDVSPPKVPLLHNEVASTTNCDHNDLDPFRKYVVVEHLASLRSLRQGSGGGCQNEPLDTKEKKKHFMRRSSVNFMHRKPLKISELEADHTFNPESLLEGLADSDQDDAFPVSCQAAAEDKKTAQSIAQAVTIPPGERQIQLVTCGSSATLDVGFSTKVVSPGKTEDTGQQESGGSVGFMLVGPIEQALIDQLANEDKGEARVEQIFRESPTVFGCLHSEENLFTKTFNLNQNGWYQLSWHNNSSSCPVLVSFMCQVEEEECM